MKKILRVISLFAITMLFIASTVNTVLALSTADAKELIDTTKLCSLTLRYAIDNKGVEGLDIELYQIADVTENFQYNMVGAFSDYPIEINNIKTQSEWNAVKDTVGAYIMADKKLPLASGTTDSNGNVSFKNLPVGLYYVRRINFDSVEHVSGFEPFIIAVPGLGDDGKWIYDVTAFPKPGEIPTPDTNKIKIVKLWKDGNQADKRPSSLSVDIYRNGEFYDSIELTADQNWSYTFETNDNYIWTAVERDVPSGYTVSILSKDGNTIQITNTNDDDPVRPPETGDNSHMLVWIIIMLISGLSLILLGGKWRKSHAE